MKRFFLVLSALAIALVPAAAPGSAGADPSDNSLHVFAVGGGSAACAGSPFSPFCPNNAVVEHFAFSAHCQAMPGVICGSEGAPTPSGYVVLRFLNSTGKTVAKVQGPVVCFSALTGGTGQGIARINFEVRRATGVASPPTYLFFFAHDFGQGSTMPDLIQAPVASTRCGTFGNTDNPVTQGNIVVALQSPAVATPLSGSWYSIGSDGSLSILTETGWEVMQ